MANVRKVQVTFDCANPRVVAEFWKGALGYVDPPDYPESGDEDHWGACQDPNGVGPRFYFQRVPEGKTVKNRVHIDVRVGVGMVGDERVAALEAEGTRLVALGARRLHLVPANEEDESTLVMQDVEGNEFCLD